MQQSSNKDLLLKQRKEIISKYDKGPIKSQVDDWENPQYSIYHETDYYGFIHDGGFTDEFLQKETRIKKLDCKREMKWRKLLDKKSGSKTGRPSHVGGLEDQFIYIKNKMNDSSFREEMTKRIYKGVPQKYKLTVWHVFLDINDMKLKKPKVYQLMLKKALEKSPDVHQIDLDVNRTFRNTTYFRERFSDRQKALFHVLSAYSMYNTEIGYCQGMSEIAGLLLMYLVDEEDVFWGLSQLMTAPKWCMHGMFVAGFPRLLTFFTHLNNILQKLLPKIAKHFEKLELMSSAYALKWFMQCFLDRVPFTLFLRVWDIYLLEGERLLIAMAYNILKLHRKRIIKMDHCSILQFFQNDIRKDFLYDDDFVIESLKACIEELRRHKLSVPPPLLSNELPTRPFGTDLDFQTPSLASVKERQTAQANPEEVIRRSIKKQKERTPEMEANSSLKKSLPRSLSEEKKLVLRPESGERIPNQKEVKSEVDSSVPSHIRYRINHSSTKINQSQTSEQINQSQLSHQINQSQSSHQINQSQSSQQINKSPSSQQINQSPSSQQINQSPSSQQIIKSQRKVRTNHDNHSSLRRPKDHTSTTIDSRHLVKSVPDLSYDTVVTDNNIPQTIIARIDKQNPPRNSLTPESNHIPVLVYNDTTGNSVIPKSQTMSSFQRPIPLNVKRTPLSSSPEYVL